MPFRYCSPDQPPMRYIRRNQEERLRVRIAASIDELFECAEKIISREHGDVVLLFRLAFEDHTDWCQNQAYNLAQLKARSTRFKAHLQPIEEAIEHTMSLIDSQDTDTLTLLARRLRPIITYSRTIAGITAVITGHMAVQDPRHHALAVDMLRQTANIMLDDVYTVQFSNASEA